MSTNQNTTAAKNVQLLSDAEKHEIHAAIAQLPEVAAFETSRVQQTELAEMELPAIIKLAAPIIKAHVDRVGSVDTRDDLIAGAFEAVLSLQKRDIVDVVNAVRGVRTGDGLMATPFSRLATGSDEEVEFDMEETIVDERLSMDNVLEEVARELMCEDLDALVQRELRKCIESGPEGSARFMLISAAWDQYRAEMLVPDEDDAVKPMFAFSTENDIVDQDIAYCEASGLLARAEELKLKRSMRGKGAYDIEREEANEWLEERSDIMMEMGGSRLVATGVRIKTRSDNTPSWQDESFKYSHDFDQRRFAPGAFLEASVRGKGANAKTRRALLEQAWIGVNSAIAAVGDAWFADCGDVVVRRLFETVAASNDGDLANALKIVARRVARKTGEEYEQVLYELIETLGLGDWMDEAECLEAREDFGVTFISRILFTESDWMDTPEMVWPGFKVGTVEAVVDAIESDDDKPSGTAVFKKAFAEAMAKGLSYQASTNLAWEAWRNVSLSSEGQQVYRSRYNAHVQLIPADANREVKREMYAAARKEAMRAARNVSAVTSTNAGKIVGMTQSGVKVNGKGDQVDLIAWDKAIVLAARLYVSAEKFESFVATAKNLGGAARVFAGAFESANKRRVEAQAAL